MKQFYRSTFGLVAGILLALAVLLGIETVTSLLKETINWLAGGGAIILVALFIVFFRLGWKGQ